MSKIIDAFDERHGTDFSGEGFLRVERVNRDGYEHTRPDDEVRIRAGAADGE